MKRLRYFTETLLVHEDLHHESQKSEALKKGKGEWLRIDDNTILGIVELDDVDFQFFMQDHPTVVILPSLHDRTSIADHYKKKNKSQKDNDHKKALSIFNVNDTDTTADVITKVMAAGHTQFSPDK